MKANITFLIIFSIICQYNSYYQAIWVESYTFDTTNMYDYYTVVMKNYNANTDFENQLPPKDSSGNDRDYYVLYKRNSGDLTEAKKMYKDNLVTYDLFSFVFPDLITGFHEKPFLIWNISVDCEAFIKFDIKFFNCDAQRDDFLTNKLSKNFYLKYSTSTNLLTANYDSGSPCGRVANATALRNMFLNYISGLDTGNASCGAECNFST